jgi:hypothetical protein
MGKRRLIIHYLSLGILVHLMLAMLAIGVTKNNGILWACFTAGVVLMFLLNLAVTSAFTKTFSKDWFKTQEQLEKEIEKSVESWSRANRLCTVLGEHEAVKLWEQAKELEKEAEKIKNTINESI